MAGLVEILAEEIDGKILGTDFEVEKMIEMDVDALAKTDDVKAVDADDDIISIVLYDGTIMDTGDDVIVDTDDEVITDIDMLMETNDVSVDDNIISVALDDGTIMSDVIVETDDDVIIGVDDNITLLLVDKVDNTIVDVDNVMTI